MMPRRRRGGFFPLLITLMFMSLFFFIPLIRLIFPKFNTYFGFIPIFFFFPFFWSFRGRKRVTHSKENNAPAGDSDDFSQIGSMNTDSNGFDYNAGMISSSPWSYTKYLAMILVIALGVVTYFFLVR